MNVDALSPEAQDDPMVQNMQKTAFMPDARAGVYFNTPRIFAGLSADNLIAKSFQKMMP